MIRTLSAAVASLLVGLYPAPHLQAADGWAVVFAPGNYESLPNSEYHRVGANRLRNRLLKAGFDKQRVRILAGGMPDVSGPATSESLRETVLDLTSKAQDGDLLLVVVASYGAHIRGRDYVCDTTATARQIAAFAGDDKTDTPDSLIPVRNIADWMFELSEKAHQCLLVDGAATDSGLDHHIANPFGTASSGASSRQYAMFSQTGKLKLIGSPQETRTVFMQSLLDAFAGHADFNGNDSVSVLELTDYMRLFAEEEHAATPRLAGGSSLDFALASVDSDTKNDGLSVELRQRLAETLLTSARTALLFERDVDGARGATRRALEYGITGPLHDEIAMMMLTLKVLEGQFDEAWNDSQKLGQPLLVYAPQNLEIKAGEKTLGMFDAGRMGLITKTAGAWARLQTIYKPAWKNDRLTFEETETTGWILGAELAKAPQESSAAELLDALATEKKN